MRSIKLVFALLAAAGLAACAPTVWSRPGTTRAEFNMDRAQCQLMAEGANPGRDVDTINTGHFKRDLAANAAVGIISGIAQGAAVSHSASLCMEARGYMPGAPDAVVSAAPAPAVLPANVAMVPAVVPAIAAQHMPPVQSASTAPLPLPAPAMIPVCPLGSPRQWGQRADLFAGDLVPVCNPYYANYIR